MNTGPRIYRLILIITLFLICIVNVCFLSVNPEALITTNYHLSGNENIKKNKDILEFKNDDSTNPSTGLKVELVTISSPVSFDSGGDHLSNLNLLIKLYSKKKYSLISHSDLIISKTLHISPLITNLQI